MRPDLPALLVAALLVPAAGAAAGPAVPDCRRATTPAERAICGNPALATADAAMARAYAALRQAAPPPRRAALETSQRDWILGRDGACAAAKDDGLAACLLAETETRRRFLAGEGANGPAGAPPLLPAFFAETRPGRYQIAVAYPQFRPPVGAAFNRAVRALTIAEKRLSPYREAELQAGRGTRNFYQVSYQTTYLDPRLAAVTFDFGDYLGGAHPNGWRAALLFDLRRDRPLNLADVLADPGKAVPAIAARCQAQLAAAAKRDGWELFDHPDFAAVVGKAASWAVDKTGVTILFDAYSVASYADGPHECRLPWAEIAGWLAPGGMLPPRQTSP